MTNLTKRTSSEEAVALLLALYRLARGNRPADLGLLAGRLGWGAGRVVRVLAHLENKGVADRAACRLTMSGLAMATQLATASAMPSRATSAA
ncbi:MAG: hypothetical protein AB8I08_21455 [Sandaracinaceae bacterium]